MSDLLLQKHNHDDFNLNDEFGQLYKWYNKSPMSQTTSITGTGSLTALNAGVVLGDTSSGAITTTLLAAAGNLGLTYFLKLVDATNNWTISRSGTDTIDTFTEIVLIADGDSVTLVSDGISRWNIF